MLNGFTGFLLYPPSLTALLTASVTLRNPNPSVRHLVKDDPPNNCLPARIGWQMV